MELGKCLLKPRVQKEILYLLTAVEKVSCCIPEGVPIDITVKLMVCLVHLNILEPLNVSRNQLGSWRMF